MQSIAQSNCTLVAPPSQSCSSNAICGLGFACQQGVCVFCQRGSVANSSSSCAQCPSGTYAYYLGATMCFSCPAGAYAVGAGNTVCTLCPVNTYSNRTGASSIAVCTACATGQGSVPGSPHSSWCVQVQPAVGYQCYSSTNLADYPGVCAAGLFCPCYSPGFGLPSSSCASQTATCQSCPAGTFNALSGPTCQACSSGSFCPDSQTPPLACPAGTSSLMRWSFFLRVRVC